MARIRLQAVLRGPHPLTGLYDNHRGSLNATANLDLPWRKVGFGTNCRKINGLVLTVDQEVGGSNPLSCAGYLALLCKTGAVVLGLSARDTLLGDAMRNLY